MNFALVSQLHPYYYTKMAKVPSFLLYMKKKNSNHLNILSNLPKSISFNRWQTLQISFIVYL